MMGAALVFNICPPQGNAVTARRLRFLPVEPFLAGGDSLYVAGHVFNTEYDVPRRRSKALEGQIADIQSRAEGQHGGKTDQRAEEFK